MLLKFMHFSHARFIESNFVNLSLLNSAASDFTKIAG